MATLIIIRHRGRTVGRCDARCHDAKTPKCNCVCGGRNHGCGYNQGLLNNQRNLAEINRTAPEGHLRIAVPLRQTTFLPEDPQQTPPATPP